MSRGGCDDYDEDFPNQGALWWANYHRALKGKRGRKALAELREALLALPQKRLVNGALSTVGIVERAEADTERRSDWLVEDARTKVEAEGPGVCAIGAYVWHQKIKAGIDPDAAFDELPILLDSGGWGLHDTADIAARAGLAYTLAYGLADRNDEIYHSMTPEERYEAFMRWLDEELGVLVES